MSDATTVDDPVAAAPTFFAERAAVTDSDDGDVRPGLRHLGDAGLLDLGVGEDGGAGVAAAVDLVERIAGECLSSAFSLWAHRMTLEYLARGRSTGLTTELDSALRSGKLVGSTAMATSLRDVAGIEPVPVVARRDGDRLRLSGPIPWASNLFPGAVIVLPARLADEADTRVVVVIRAGDPGVDITEVSGLLALNATGSGTVRLSDVDVGPEAVLSTDLPGFVDAFRRTFLLLQTAFCTGLATRSLAEADARLGPHNAELAEDLAMRQAEGDGLRHRLRTLTTEHVAAEVTEFIRIRLDGAGLAVAATRLESTVRGGAGYLAASPTARRLREAAFLPIQAPTEGHLRWELRHSG